MANIAEITFAADGTSSAIVLTHRGPFQIDAYGSTFGSGVITGELSPDGGTTWRTIAGLRFSSNSDSPFVTGGVQGDQVRFTMAGSTNPSVTLKVRETAGVMGVQVSAVNPGTAAASLGKAEDAAHASGDTGVMALTVRKNTAAATSGSDGDYQPLITDTNGLLHVNVGVFTPGTAADSLGKAEDAGHTTGDTGVMMLGVVNTSTAALAGSNLDYNPLQMDLKGEARVVAGGYQARITATKTRPSDTTAYAAGDVLNESDSAGTGWTFSSCARLNGGSGIIQGATLIDSANQTTKGSFELWLFRNAPAADNDNAVFTPTDAELLDVVAVIPFSTVYVGDATSGANGNCVHLSQPVSIPFVCDSDDTALYGVLVVRNAYTPVSAEVITINLKMLQD